MSELVVISGKGGTGKTSLVASFAALAERKVLADCDVDAADLHLVLAPEIRQSEEFWAGHVAVTRPHDCAGCGRCFDLCRFGAVRERHDETGRRIFTVEPSACEGCGVCVHFCPEQALDFPERRCGEWFISETRHGPLVHARLAPGAENSGKLVTLVRREAQRLAGERGLGLVIIDGAPGIGCPVIASLAGATRALAVTEPTLAGLHDLERVIELAGQLRVPIAVCVNKHDLNPELTERIERFCRERNVEVAGRVPYDEGVTRAQVAGASVVEHGDGPAARAIRQVWAGVAGRADPARGARADAPAVPPGR